LKQEKKDIVKIFLKALSSRSELHEVLGTAIEILKEYYHFDAGAVYLFNPSFEKLSLEFQFGLSTNLINNIITNGIEKSSPELFIFPPNTAISVRDNLSLSDVIRNTQIEKKYSFKLITLTLVSEKLKRGFVYLFRREPFEISADDLGIIEEILEILSVLIGKAQIYDELHKTIIQLERLINVQNSVLFDLEYENILSRSMNEIKNIFNPDYAEIIMIKNGGFESLDINNTSAEIKPGDEGYILHHNTLNILQKNKDFLIFDNTKESRLKFPYNEYHSIKSCVILPIFIEKNIAGFFIIGKNKISGFVKEDIPLYTAFPFLISQALFISKQHQNILNLQNQLYQAAKMESIGIIASGISHDFNNALTGLMGAAELIDISVKNDPKLSKYTRLILNAAQRMSSWSKQLLAYAKGGLSFPTEININESIIKSLNVVQSNFNKKINLHISLDHQVPLIQADEDNIEQVITNVLLNSGESIIDKGNISISSENILPNSKLYQEKNLSKEHEYIRILIKDTGCGIDEKIVDKVFDPFVTTKFQGRGLGLSAVYGIVAHLNGKVFLESTVNQGTEVEIFLPGISKLPAKIKEDRRKSRDTVLILSNPETAQAPDYKILALNGYNTIESFEISNALEIIRNESLSVVFIDLIFSNIIMENFLLDIKKSKRGIKILTALDMADKPLLEDLKEKSINFIFRPLSKNDLLNKIKSMIENK
jgi:two-component system, cell cycle sensor histidine kinase and response regulator CckA